MQTFEEIFCSRHACDPGSFRSRVFRASLPGYARLLSYVVGGINNRWFGCDCVLLFAVAECLTVEEVRRELAQYCGQKGNQVWLRRVARIRISRRRLLAVAGSYLPEGRR